MPEPEGAPDGDGAMLYAVAILVVFFLVDNVREGMLLLPAFEALYRDGHGYLGNVIWKLLQVPLVVAAVMAIRRVDAAAAAEELGLGRPPWRGVGVTLVATLPGAVVLLATGGLRADVDPAYLTMTAMASPVSEELLYRAFLVGGLWLYGRWPFWLAVLVSAVPFGLSHLYQAESLGQGLPGALGVVAFTAAGSAIFAWLMVRWRRDLWVPIGYHAFANLWFYLFAAGTSPLASPGGFGGTVLTAAGVVAITVWRTGGWRVSRSMMRAPESAGVP